MKGILMETSCIHSSGRKYKKINLNVSTSFFDCLGLIAEDECTDLANVIRKAVTFYARAKVNQRDRKLLATVRVSDNNQMEIENVIQL